MENFINRKQHGMLFNSSMVQALLSGRKTVTRRLLKPKNKPKIGVGDLIYVKETFMECEGKIIYKADYPNNEVIKWTPALFMPKKHSRIWLEVTEIRVEKLQDITEEEAIAEGILCFEYVEPIGFYCNYLAKELTYQQFREAQFATATESYKSLWESINGVGAWDENPYVSVIQFRRIDNPCTKVFDANGQLLQAGDRVYSYDYDDNGKPQRVYGNFYKNIEYPQVSDWYIAYDDGKECAVLDMATVFKV